MHMGIDQAGQHRLSLQVEQLRLWAFGLENFVVGADTKNSAALDSQRLPNREMFVDGDNFAVVENQVRLEPVRWFGCRGASAFRPASRRARQRIERDRAGQQPPHSGHHGITQQNNCDNSMHWSYLILRWRAEA